MIFLYNFVVSNCFILIIYVSLAYAMTANESLCTIFARAMWSRNPILHIASPYNLNTQGTASLIAHRNPRVHLGQI